jgi:hypothetical protein
MSTHSIHLIPRDTHFVPSPPDIASAEALLTELAGRADEISGVLKDTVQFRDCGENFERVACPVCDLEVSNQWWLEQMNAAWNSGFDLQPLLLPCGHRAGSLNELHYRFEQGFSRFVLSAVNPTNPGALTAEQVARFEELLRCPLKVIYQHL